MTPDDQVLHVTAAVVATAIVVLVLGLRARNGKVRISARGIGYLLAFLGAYFFPLGAVEAYDATRIAFDLSESVNAVLWYVVATVLIVVGVLLAGRRSS